MSNAPMKPMRTRMAPSPTGYMHVGTLRTVLYDYFLARQSGGQFIMRIEDTDQERLVDDAMVRLLQTMNELGLDYDEGPTLNADVTLGEKGAYGPYIQSQRLHLYRPYADQLVKQGDAYPCFCSVEALAKMREEQTLLKLAPRYDRRCLRLSTEEIAERLARGDAHVIRMRIPTGSCSFVDGIRGEISFQNTEVDDQIIIKSDGFPSYHLAVVVDDHLMKITHVLRGEEWISSTPKQIILHQMLGWEMPVYAHVPLLLNPDKSKLSKRKGDVAVEQFLEHGYLPEALINFLALLGWNPTDDREVFTVQELTSLFTLSKVNKAGAVLNIDKLTWMNAQYIKMMDDEIYMTHCRPFLPAVTDEAFARRVCHLVKDRLQFFKELPELCNGYFDVELSYETSLLQWKTQTQEEVRERLTGVLGWVNDRSEDAFATVADVERDLREWIQTRGWGNGDTLWPLRVALSGAKQSPSPFELIVAYGKERTRERIDQALARLS